MILIVALSYSAALAINGAYSASFVGTFCLANCVEIILAAALFTSFIGNSHERAYFSSSEILKMFVLVSLVPAIFSGIISIGALKLHFIPGIAFLPSYINWVAGSATGIVVVTLSTVLVLANPKPTLGQVLELMCVGLLIVWMLLLSNSTSLVVLFTGVMPIVIYAAIRHQVLGSVATFTTIAVTALVAFSRKETPFWNENIGIFENAQATQSFIYFGSFSFLVLGSALLERNHLISKLDMENKAILSLQDAKAKFIANMSHELRTPITTIIGFSEMLAEEFETDKKVVEDVAKITFSGRYLLSLVNEVLDIEKIESEEFSIKIGVVKMSDILESIKTSTEHLISQQDNEFILDIDPQIEFLQTDEFRLCQILTNLISNAAKFTKKGTIELKVKSLSSNQIEFEVKDSGFGIAAENIEKIFQKFTQVHDINSDILAGTGLGLPIVKSLVECLQGTIQVESRIGEGSRFIVRLPQSYDNQFTRESKNVA